MEMERQDILDTIGILTTAEYWLQSLAMVGSDDVKKIHEKIKEEANRLRKLYSDSEPGAKERFREIHPPSYDQLDNIYDCLNPECPTRGFKSKESKDQHYEMWGVEPRR